MLQIAHNSLRSVFIMCSSVNLYVILKWVFFTFLLPFNQQKTPRPLCNTSSLRTSGLSIFLSPIFCVQLLGLTSFQRRRHLQFHKFSVVNWNVLKIVFWAVFSILHGFPHEEILSLACLCTLALASMHPVCETNLLFWCLSPWAILSPGDSGPWTSDLWGGCWCTYGPLHTLPVSDFLA